MTTRRRRAGSSECEESLPQDQLVFVEGKLPTVLPANQLAQTPRFPSFNWSNQASPEAIYKKTDGVTSSHQPTFYNPNQYNNNNQQYNTNNTLQSQPDCTRDQLENNNFLFISEEFETSVMACRDRSNEFMGIIRSQKQGHMSNGAQGAKQQSGRDLAQYSMFMKRSRMVGRNISSTYAKLEKLTLLAKKRSLFDDSQDAEVQELTAIIRHDLTSLTKQLEDLRQSSHSSTSSTNHMQKHSANLVGSLQSKVANITSKFRDVLEVRTENLKKQAERREHFTGAQASHVPLMNGTAGQAPPAHTASVMLADEAKANALARRGNAGSKDFVLDLEEEAGGDRGGGGGAYEQQLNLMEEQDSLLNSRAETMKTIESTIVELGTMFSQLATMVKEQDELVHRIDANVEDAELNVDAAHTELLKYFKNISSNRMLMVKVFGIVMVFFVIFIVFMA